MNISVCPLQDASDRVRIVCPGCHSPRCHKHGSYFRKGFHTQRNHVVTLPVKVQRYRCLNPECPQCTFSVLPPQVLRYCRFFWPCLLAIQESLAAGLTCYHLACHVWHVGWGVIRRAATQLDRLGLWVQGLHQELTNGGQVRELGSMVKIITRKIGRLELLACWYRHRYPMRCIGQNSTPHN